ncbi:MAG: microviridin/marinostatin family tricyclic proteinase inhibitor [Leptolyngbya sp. SIO1E4]|nr:microviridin/marinostatin family tricyclic proteinase inhibitor [Leptolyngbya sp. SIO1E4]
MNDNHPIDAREVPFFARYLEKQITQELSEEEAKKVSGGVSPLVTFKTPSDIDEVATPKKFDVTHKYPSDGDEDHGVPM